MEATRQKIGQENPGEMTCWNWRNVCEKGNPTDGGGREKDVRTEKQRDVEMSSDWKRCCQVIAC